MKTATIKSNLWFFVILLLAFSFPLQVYFNSPLPSLFPYLLICIIVALDLGTSSIKTPKLLRWSIKKPIETIITIFVFLVLFQTSWQIHSNFVSFEGSISAIVIFIFPIIFYIYFRNVFDEKEIRSILFSIAFAGLIVGIYFAYDSVSKLIFGIVPGYDKLAHNYSIGRMGQTLEESNLSRIGLTSRSMGLLEKHSITAAWNTFGCFAALSLLPYHATIKRILIISSYGVFLFLGLNFTGIIAFLFIVFLIEFQAYYILYGVLDRRGLLKIFFFMSAFVVALLFISMTDFKFSQAIQRIVGLQYDVITGSQVTRSDGFGYFRGLLSDFASFPVNMLQFPLGILIGDGFTTEFGVIEKGGDYGFVETLHRVGLPLFFIIYIGIIGLIGRSLQQVRSLMRIGKRNAHYLQFASSVIIYILFAEIHYSIWSAKSVLPIFFFCLAIFSFNLSSLNQHNSNCRVSPSPYSM